MSPQTVPYLESDAVLSADGWYRYVLRRRLGAGDRTVLFVGLNPSTADADRDDPTIRKCVGFARRWGFDWLVMANLHAYRSTDPKRLRHISPEAAIGPENRAYLLEMGQRSSRVVAAWGQNTMSGAAHVLGRMVLNWPQTRVLGWNDNGTPKHPLYLPYETALLDATAPQARGC